ncbi:MAG: hypothetical protein WBB45_06215 [Cyclobacteriaceae bacterium]
MEKWLAGFAKSYGGKLSMPRSSSWRGTTDLTFSKYYLIIPVANRTLEIELLYREAYGRFGNHFQARSTMLISQTDRTILTVTRRSWWHRLYRSTFRADDPGFDKKYVVKGNSDLAADLFQTRQDIGAFMEASPVGLFVRSKKGRLSAHMYGLYNHLPEQELAATIHLFYRLDSVF